MGSGTDHAKWLRATLAAERVAKGWSLEQAAREVAKELDERDEDGQLKPFPRQNIYSWESFRTQPRIDQFAAWARALGLRLSVDLVRVDEDAVVLHVPRDVARLVRMLMLLPPGDLEIVTAMVTKILPESVRDRIGSE